MFPTLLFLHTALAGSPDATPPRADSTYVVAVVSGIGARRTTAEDTLHLSRVERDTWSLSQRGGESVWEDGDSVRRVDPSAPRDGDPWPIVLQRAVGSVPATVRFDDEGRPVELLDAEGWSQAARTAIEQAELPAVARLSGEALIDPDGLIRTLGRSFVGTPSEAWSRPDRLAGVDVLRLETCERTRERGLTTWTCRGSATGPDGNNTQLQDAATWTTVTIDRRGLVSVEDGWSGTLVHLDRDGQTITDSPVGGRRLLQRLP